MHQPYPKVQLYWASVHGNLNFKWTFCLNEVTCVSVQNFDRCVFFEWMAKWPWEFPAKSNGLTRTTSQLKIHINEMHYNSYPYVEVRSIANGDGKWWDLLDFQLWLRVSVFGCCSDTNRMINWKLIFGIDLCCDNKFSGHFRCVWQIELNWSGLLMTNDANATTWWK